MAAWDLDAPREMAWSALRFASIGLTASQMPSRVGTGKYTITLEGLLV